MSAEKKLRDCPLCGGEIFALAIKCKHCKNAVRPLKEGNYFTTAGNTPGNIVNGGCVALQDNWIYYNDVWQGNMRKAHINGSGDVELINNNARYINIVDDWVYYSNNSIGRKIFKIRTDGSNRTQINNDWSVFLCTTDDWIYYVNVSDDCSIYKIRTDGSERTKLNDDKCSFLNVSDNWIFYVKNDTEDSTNDVFIHGMLPHGKIHKMQINGSNHTCLSSEEAKYINVADDWIYYSNLTDSKKLYKIQTDGSGREKITDHEARYVNVVDNWIYYHTHGEKEGLYKIRNDGRECTRIYPYFIKFINIVGGWIYGLDGEDWECRLHTSGKYYALMAKKHHSALHLRVEFEDGRSYIYRTLDHDIKVGSKVKVEGKMSNLIGEVVERKVKFSKNHDAFYISEVIS